MFSLWEIVATLIAGFNLGLGVGFIPEQKKLGLTLVLIGLLWIASLIIKHLIHNI